MEKKAKCKTKKYQNTLNIQHIAHTQLFFLAQFPEQQIDF